ncbi:hypothetical protein [Streptomyces acidiscabies]|uniref:hypothetical protein n=1 Tax=Streptomyces acidiscabies TaxID=42234 RepID=UPI0009520950|nr:hypothetical protein [Streptomyces acidiscabies]
MTMQRRSFVMLSAAGAASVGRARVLRTHGDRDGTCPTSSARQAYRELTAAMEFLTFRGANHSNRFGDSAARDRLRVDATSSTTTWESALS